MSFFSAIPSRDGKRLFTVGATMRGELVRHDARSKQFLPCFGGVSAEYASFSKDGQWVAYVSYPEGTLWRSKVDGSERLQLTYPPGYAFLPRWSPDGKRLVFFEERSGKSRKIYEVSRDGGTARQLLPADSRQQEDPNWSPDGSTIVFGANVGDPHATIRILDRKTSRISTLPGSQGLFSPRWSPDGRYLAALRVDSSAVVVFDTTTQKWAELAKGVMGWPNWSHDGKSLYLLESSGAGTVIKIRMSDRKTEPVLDLKNFVTAGYYGGALALAPDDSPLLLRDAGIYDVYALDW